MLDTFNKWDIIQFKNKNISGEEFDSIYKVVLDGISNNMA